MWKLCNSFLINYFRITILVHIADDTYGTFSSQKYSSNKLLFCKSAFNCNFIQWHFIILTFIVHWDHQAAGRTAGHRSCLQLSAWGPERAHVLPPRHLICSCTCFVLPGLQLQEHNAFWAWGFVLLRGSHDCEVSTADILEAGWEGE